MTSTLTLAHENLFRRPPEERFGSFAALRENAAQQRKRCREIEARDLAILFGEQGDAYFGDHCVRPTHFSYGQLASVARVPLAVLARLDAPTRASVMNQCYERSRRFRIGLCDGDDLRAVTSDRYERVWDEELYEVLDRWLLPSGFIPAVPTNGGANARGDDKPSLYRSDRDSFAFFYSERTPADSFGGLRKGVLVFNSEVGAKCLGFATFVFSEVCANHLIWGAGELVEKTARHTSQARELFQEFDRELRRISNEMTSEELRVIERAARTQFVPGGGPEDAQDRLAEEFGVPRKHVADVVASAGDLTTWGIVNGVTAAAKSLPYAEQRVELSRLAGVVLESR